MRFEAQESDYLSDGALRALNAVLSDLALVLTQEDGQAVVLLTDDETEILRMQTAKEQALLSAGGYTAAQPFSYIEWQAAPAYAQQAMQALGGLLAGWETTGASSADLGDAGKPKTQAVYALSGEEWANVWTDVCGVLTPALAQVIQSEALYAQACRLLEGVTIAGKGTLRRYFAQDGAEMGAYFYAAQANVGENDTREVRLEYGVTPDKGFYLAFRCPNKKETRNLRLSIKGKASERNGRTTYTFTYDVRRTYDGEGDTYVAEGTLRKENDLLTGEMSLSMTKKRAEGTVKSGLAIEPAISLAWGQPTGTMTVVYTQGGQMLMTGTLALEGAAQKMAAANTVNADMQQIQTVLSRSLLMLLQKAEASDRQELLHYLAGERYLEGETTQLSLENDDDFTVREEP